MKIILVYIAVFHLPPSGGDGNFTLSTSFLGYTPVLGGLPPMCKDGYGVFYNMQPDQ